MAKMFTSGFKPKSTTKKAKQIIRNEMLSYFSARDYGTKTRLQAMKRDADTYNGGKVYSRGYVPTEYAKGSALVDAGSLRVYYSDQANFLSKIYGKENVSKWNGEKIHNTYKHLIGREYSSMLAEKEKLRSLKKK